MKRDGWTFASHSWGHIDFANSSYHQIVRDTKRWKNEVEPIIGKQTYLYIHTVLKIEGLKHINILFMMKDLNF